MRAWQWLTGTGPTEQDRSEARAAMTNATASLNAAESRTEEITTLADNLRKQGVQNHFIERLNMHVTRGNHAHGL
jgi:hypothetical protein